MTLNRKSSIREVWRHPVGHDILCSLLRATGRSQSWLLSPLVAGLPLGVLDRLAGDGFADMVAELSNAEPDRPLPPAQEQRSWWKEAVVYQIYLPGFMDGDHDGVGDLAGATQRLPYLARLGVDTLWLCPLTGAPGEAEEAGGFENLLDLCGGEEALEEFVEAAHARDMRVILAVDIASAADNHPWFEAALQGDKTAQEYFILRRGSPDAPPNNWQRPAGGAAWKWYPEMGAWGLHLGEYGRIDLNWDNPDLRQKFEEVLAFWLNRGVDGFYFPHINQLNKASFADGKAPAARLTGMRGFECYGYGPCLHRYLKELRSACGGEIFTAGGIYGLGTETAKLFTGEDRAELDLALDESHISGPPWPGEEGTGSLPGLKRYYLRWMEQYGNLRWMPLLLETAGTPRILGRLRPSPAYRSTLAKLLAIMLFTLRGTPLLYQGQELGIANTRFRSPGELRDPAALRLYGELQPRLGEQAAFELTLASTADHTRAPMPWNLSRNHGFTGAAPWMRLPDGAEYLNAAAEMEDPNSVWCCYQRLIALRKAHPCLVYGSFKPVFVNNRRAFCYFRLAESEKWYVEMNLTEREIPRPGRILKTQKLMLSNYSHSARSLRPYEANLYLCE